MNSHYNRIMQLPVGIDVFHLPNPVIARLYHPSGYRFTWAYQTVVATREEPLTIEEFGSFHKVDDKWVFSTYTRKPFTGEDFADWYKCGGARLNLETLYTDPDNWSGSDQLRSSEVLWYFIGRNEAGTRFRGCESVFEKAEVTKEQEGFSLPVFCNLDIDRFTELAQQGKTAIVDVRDDAMVFRCMIFPGPIFHKYCVHLHPSNPKYVVDLLLGKSLQINYEVGSFKRVWVDSITDRLWDAKGALKDGIQEIQLKMYRDALNKRK